MSGARCEMQPVTPFLPGSREGFSVHGGFSSDEQQALRTPMNSDESKKCEHVRWPAKKRVKNYVYVKLALEARISCEVGQGSCMWSPRLNSSQFIEVFMSASGIVRVTGHGLYTPRIISNHLQMVMFQVPYHWERVWSLLTILRHSQPTHDQPSINHEVAPCHIDHSLTTHVPHDPSCWSRPRILWYLEGREKWTPPLSSAAAARNPSPELDAAHVQVYMTTCYMFIILITILHLLTGTSLWDSSICQALLGVSNVWHGSGAAPM